MHNRFKKRGKFERPKHVSPTYTKRFGKLKRKVWVIDNTVLFPIVGCSHDPPMNFSQEKTLYTVEGRQLLHKNLNGNVLREITRMATGFYGNRPIEYLDNRISRYSMKNRKCEVTGLFLYAEDVHCHHYLPVNLGGTDEFKNLWIVHKDIHKLIHSTNPDAIRSLITEFDINGTQLAKLNRYRM